MKVNIIEIEISGPVASGKSAVLASIRSLLEEVGYCVAIPDAGERFNPSLPIYSASVHERPHPDRTVFVLKESTHAALAKEDKP
jgi:hypothetical protein